MLDQDPLGEHTYYPKDGVRPDAGEVEALPTPFGNRVLVQVDPAEEEYQHGSLVLQKTDVAVAAERPTKGTVVRVGPGKLNELTGQIVPCQGEPGHRVLFSKYSGTEMTFNGIPYLLMHDSDLFCHLGKINLEDAFKLEDYQRESGMNANQEREVYFQGEAKMVQFNLAEPLGKIGEKLLREGNIPERNWDNYWLTNALGQPYDLNEWPGNTDFLTTSHVYLKVRPSAGGLVT